MAPLFFCSSVRLCMSQSDLSYNAALHHLQRGARGEAARAAARDIHAAFLAGEDARLEGMRSMGTYARLARAYSESQSVMTRELAVRRSTAVRCYSSTTNTDAATPPRTFASVRRDSSGHDSLSYRSTAGRQSSLGRPACRAASVARTCATAPPAAAWPAASSMLHAPSYVTPKLRSQASESMGAHSTHERRASAGFVSSSRGSRSMRRRTYSTSNLHASAAGSASNSAVRTSEPHQLRASPTLTSPKPSRTET